MELKLLPTRPSRWHALLQLQPESVRGVLKHVCVCCRLTADECIDFLYALWSGNAKR